MNYTEIIPAGTKAYTITVGSRLIDTNGLCCRLLAENNGVYITTSSSVSQSDAYLVKTGETLDFCGKIYISSASDSSTVRLMFYQTL